MSARDFTAKIEAARDGAELRKLRVEIHDSRQLLEMEKRDLDLAVNLRFSQLNAATLGPQKGRWDTDQR